MVSRQGLVSFSGEKKKLPLRFAILKSSVFLVEEADDGNDSYEARAIKRKIARKKAQEIAARAQVNTFLEISFSYLRNKSCCRLLKG